jgi:GDP/UDP-N,N'-diacetylbacillosamine 2-epimerase (hydrolysing)
MNLGFITTSRADFGIYLPLLKAVAKENWTTYLFAGGMHTSAKFGHSYRLIQEEYNFKIAEKVSGVLDDDSPSGIARSMGVTTSDFGAIWKKYKNRLDMVFAMGDRFEMFSAALALLPFNISLAHLHGGETTLGAIDDKLRRALTSIADFHFTSTEGHASAVRSITNSNEHVYNVGALGIDGIKAAQFLTPDEFKRKFDFNIDEDYVLLTYHPETVDLRNDEFAGELIKALKTTQYRILCTLPNADTEGTIIRSRLLKFEKEDQQKIKCFENLGQAGYLTAMKNCRIVIGNSSSGIIEAASFNKPVVNIGNRQKGRTCGKNVVHVNNDADDITDGIAAAQQLIGKKFDNPYGDGHAAQKIVNILKLLK